MMAPMAAHKRTLYDILGVAPDASAIDIWNAYEERKEELQNMVPQDPSAMALAHQAHEVLTNPKRRAAYDASLAPPAEPPPVLESEQPAPVVEVEEEEPEHKLPWAAIAIASGVVIAGLIFGLRNRKPAPPSPAPAVAEAEAETPKPAAPPPPAPRTSAQILAAALPSVARLQSFEMSGRAVSVGLALTVEPGVMITTCHGIPAGVQLVASVGAKTHSAALAVTDEVLDLCKLNVPGFDAQPLAIAAEDPKVADKIYALGANAAGDFALTEGIVKHIMKTPAGNVIEISVPIAPTASGGAVFDTHGKLVGIGTTPHPYAAGANVALPASWIAQARSRGK
jgi:S1-C subfamily serine protease